MGMNAEQTPVTTIVRDKAAILDDIFERMAAGESVLEICKGGGDYPNMRMFWRWIAADKAVQSKYELALAARAHAMAEELVALSDDASKDYVTDAAGTTRFDAEAVARSKLRVNTRQWVISRLLPKKYGDKIIHAGDPDAPLFALPPSHADL